MFPLTPAQRAAAEAEIVSFLANPFGAVRLGDLPLMARVKFDVGARRAFARAAVSAALGAPSEDLRTVINTVDAFICDPGQAKGPVAELFRRKSADIADRHRARGDYGPTMTFVAAKNVVLRVFRTAGHRPD
jgi:hypothetical protein